jgi:hypothetical protein
VEEQGLLLGGWNQKSVKNTAGGLGGGNFDRSRIKPYFSFSFFFGYDLSFFFLSLKK